MTMGPKCCILCKERRTRQIYINKNEGETHALIACKVAAGAAAAAATECRELLQIPLVLSGL